MPKLIFFFVEMSLRVHFAYLATALAEGVVTQLHSVHGELPVALPVHGHDLRIKFYKLTVGGADFAVNTW